MFNFIVDYETAIWLSKRYLKVSEGDTSNFESDSKFKKTRHKRAKRKIIDMESNSTACKRKKNSNANNEEYSSAEDEERINLTERSRVVKLSPFPICTLRTSTDKSKNSNNDNNNNANTDFSSIYNYVDLISNS